MSNKGGRPTKLTKERQEKIVSFIKAGNYAKVACLCSGISAVTFCAWRNRGLQAIEEGRVDKYVKFLKAIDEARAFAEARNVTLVNQAAQTDAKHAEWWLERTNWKKWGRKDTLKQLVSGPDGKPLQIQHVPLNLSDFTDAELALMEKLGVQAGQEMENAAS